MWTTIHRGINQATTAYIILSLIRVNYLLDYYMPNQ